MILGPSKGLSKAIGNLGKRWTMRVAKKPLKSAWGWCDWEKREIVLCPHAEKKGYDRETLIHEVSHRYMPWMNEDCITIFAKEMDDILDVAGL